MSLPTLEPVGALLREHSEKFRDLVHEQLFSTELQSRQVFPSSRARTHLDLAPALAWVLERSTIDARVPDEVMRTARRLGLSHRRHGFPSEIYTPFADMLVHALREVNFRADPRVSAALIIPAETVIRNVCNAMRASANTADFAGDPAAFAASVTAVRRISSRISVVTLDAGPGLDYRPGQSVQVTAPYLPGLWRRLTPAGTANAGGGLEFHVQAVYGGDASGLLAAPRVGDYWTLGGVDGGLELPADGELTILAFGTGLAVAESVLFSLVNESSQPRTRLIVAAEYPGELYDLPRLHRLAEYADWLSVTAAVENPEDPWWLPRPGNPRLSSTDVNAELVDPVELAAPGITGEIIVAGPGEKVGEAVDKLRASGAEHIQTVSYAPRGQWER